MKLRYYTRLLVGMVLVVGLEGLALAQIAFTPHVISSSQDGATGVSVADLDGDGDLDVLSTGTGVSVADLDGDGDLDVLSTGFADGLVLWHENDGSQTFIHHVITGNIDFPHWVDAADLDGDGDLDVLSASRADDTVAWYENDGAESFTPHVITADANTPLTVAAADIDGDGDLDLLSAAAGDGEVVWYENQLNVPPPVPELFAEVPSYTEGIVFDAAGNAYVSEPYRGPVTKIAPDGTATIWAEMQGPNGHKILDDGTHLICDQDREAVVHLSAEGEELGIRASTCGTEPLRRPNDLVLDANGGFYFTDPPEPGRTDGRVCYVDADGASTLVADVLGFPNGIALNSEETELYVAAMFENAIYAYSVEAPGRVGAQRTFAELPTKPVGFHGPDGIAFDEKGHLYVAHFGMGEVQVLNTLGDLICTLQGGVGEHNMSTSNVAFGPMDGQLYMTGGPNGSNGTGVLYRVTVTATSAQPRTLPPAAQVLEAYPNPFRDQATVTIERARPGPARIEVFDLLGRRRAVLFDGHLPPGSQTFRFEAGDLPGGVYLVRVQTASGTQVRSLVRFR